VLDYARVRRIAVSVPLIPSLLEPPSRFYLRGQADPSPRPSTLQRWSATMGGSGHDREVWRTELRKRLRRAGIGRRHHVDDVLERQIAIGSAASSD